MALDLTTLPTARRKTTVINRPIKFLRGREFTLYVLSIGACVLTIRGRRLQDVAILLRQCLALRPDFGLNFLRKVGKQHFHRPRIDNYSPLLTASILAFYFYLVQFSKQRTITQSYATLS